jgi:hypothetical protein
MISEPKNRSAMRLPNAVSEAASAPDTNREFNLLNTDLVVLAGSQFYFYCGSAIESSAGWAGKEACHVVPRCDRPRGEQSVRRCIASRRYISLGTGS